MKLVSSDSLGLIVAKNMNGLIDDIPDLRPGDLLLCRRSNPYFNSWCKGKDHDGFGCEKCFSIFLKYTVSRVRPYTVWCNILPWTKKLRNVEKISALAVCGYFNRVMSIDEVI